MDVKLTKKRRDTAWDISVLVLGMLILIYEFPILERNVPNVILIGLMALYLLLNLNSFTHMPRRKFCVLLLFAFCAVMEFIYRAFGISSAEPYYYFNTIKYFFFFIVMLMTFDKLNPTQMRFLLYVTLVSVLITAVSNIGLYLRYGPTKYVVLFRSTLRYTTNSIDTRFVSALLVLSGALFVHFLQGKKGRVPALLITIFLAVFSVAIAQRTIILGMMLAMFPLLVLFNTERSWKRYLWTAFGIIVIVVVLLNLTSILSWVSGQIGSARIRRRFESIIYMLQNNSIETAGGSLQERYELVATSVRTFTSSAAHFFFGAGDHRATNEIIGNHSQIIDEFARYGVIGAGFMFLLLHCSFQYIRAYSGTQPKTSLRRQLNVILVIVLLRSLIGSLFDAPIGIQLYLILPIVFRLLVDRRAARPGAIKTL